MRKKQILSFHISQSVEFMLASQSLLEEVRQLKTWTQVYSDTILRMMNCDFLANGTFVDGRQIKANQHVLLRKPAQIVLGEMTGVLILTGKISNWKALIIDRGRNFRKG